MADLEQQMWQMFLDSLAQKVGGVDPTEFLPTNGLALADWQVMNVTGLPLTGTQQPGDPLVTGVVQWADTMPQWNPTYIPGDSLYQNYVDFLNSIQLKGGDPAQQQIADAYSKNVATARQQLATDTNAMIDAWVAFSAKQAALPPSVQQTYTQWYNANWAQTITDDQSNLAAQDKNYRQALQAVGGPDYQTISAAQTRASLSPGAGNTLTDPTGLSFPRYDITPDLNQWYLSALQTVTAGRPPQIDFTVDLSQANTYQSQESQYLSGSVAGQYSGFFWGGSASASYDQAKSRTDYSQLVSNMKLHYTAQTATVFTVGNPPWFDTGVVSEFADQISPNSALANKPLFGPGGFLNLRAVQLVAVFKPTITLIGSTSDISALSSAFNQQSGGTVSVAGLSWSVGASVSQGTAGYSATVTQSGAGNTVQIADNTNNPKVVGVIPQQLGKVAQPA